MKDWAHKIFSPGTYPCSLCALTYSNTGMRKKWRDFINDLECEVEFLHSDELEQQHGIVDVPLPAAFIHQGGNASLWIDSDAMDACGSLEDLQDLLQARLTQQETPA